MWWKYFDEIIPPNQQLKRLNKVSLHQTFHDSLIDFLCTDLDGNISFIMNPYCVPKFTEYFSDLFKGMSETQIWKQLFKRTMENSTFKRAFIDHMKETAILGTVIPLSICTNIFHQRFEKHSVLESTLEIMQHCYVQMETEPSRYPLFPWRYGLLHFKVFQMSHKRFSSWLDWRNSNACTHSNVGPLAHDFTKGLGHDSTK
jgi:hypothetical protein